MPPVTVPVPGPGREGTVQRRQSLFVEIQLLDPRSRSDELVPLSDWILEHATVVVEPELADSDTSITTRSCPVRRRRDGRGSGEGEEQDEEEEEIEQDGHGEDRCRLSGGLMRNHFYFATAPGNEFLYIATKLHNLYRELPSVG